ncbi:MAG: hypothetical protein DI577_00890 [Microbacterium sp.]|nr:MAG: hypothetical protein DI577_00890 [Microbacterium sp.]PZU38363.1 MAG: hypothetical protein DI575_00890 [Microbacterium sp.]
MIDQLPAMLITLTTLCCCLMIGLGFLPRPSRESAIWSGAFVSAMVASYFFAAVAGDDNDRTDDALAAWLPAAIGGLVVLALGLVWVGLRVRRGRRVVMIAPTLVVAAVLIAALATTDGTDATGVTRAVAAGVAGLAAAGIAIELAGIRTAHRSATLPLTVGAGIVAMYAVVWIAAGTPWNGTGRLADDLPVAAEFAPALTTIALVTALVTLLLLTRGETAPAEERETSGFRAVARDRLARAERLDDSWWSVLDVRLDDPTALREASSALGYTRVLDRFADDVTAVFPAEADLEQVEPTRFLVLLPRHEPSVRPLLRTLLDRVSTVSAEQPVDVRLSVSIGWASAGEIGYDLDDLIDAASAAADTAQLAGGDCWERALSVAGAAGAAPPAP